MLFNSLVFIFGFLPIALLLTYAARPFSTPAKLVLAGLSLGFYAWWKPSQLIILAFSILFNFLVGGAIQAAHAAGRQRAVRAWLVLGLAVDLGLLGWFKYANFVVDNLNGAFAAGIPLRHIALPLAISFFTFQKLAYLIDSARGEARRMSLIDFTLFASFFPQLIAGPIVHYREVVPQFQKTPRRRLIEHNLMVGLVLFAIGLFKKTVIADTLATYATPLFDGAAPGVAYDPVTAWLAAATFMFQVYFDFSGYSDMAIGLGRMFGIKLPLNFHSPLRAGSAIDYWRRWHMTLQRFIVAYLFQPLSLPLNRLSARLSLSRWPAFFVAIIIPSFITFLAVGIWHGAGWTFVCYGLLQAALICLNQYWREHRTQRRRALKKLGRTLGPPGRGEIAAYHLLTLISVLFSDVLFRARHVSQAWNIWKGMVGVGGHDPPGVSHLTVGLVATLVCSGVLVFLFPNSQQIMGRFDPAFNWRDWNHVGRAPLAWTWRPNAAGVLFAGSALFLGIMFIQRGRAVFLYFNF